MTIKNEGELRKILAPQREDCGSVRKSLFPGNCHQQRQCCLLAQPRQDSSSSWGSRTGGSKPDEVGKLLCGPIADILLGTQNLPGHIEVGDSPLRVCDVPLCFSTAFITSWSLLGATALPCLAFQYSSSSAASLRLPACRAHAVPGVVQLGGAGEVLSQEDPGRAEAAQQEGVLRALLRSSLAPRSTERFGWKVSNLNDGK
nr:uncharacterized protein LOC123569045 [Macaca fascicularis]